MKQETPLYRQINKKLHLVDGIVSYQAFVPTPRDQKMLSVDDGEKISGKDSYLRFKKKWSTIGVLAVTVGECDELKFPVIPDPSDWNDSHSLINMTCCSTLDEILQASLELYEFAAKRGWIFPVENAEKYPLK